MRAELAVLPSPGAELPAGLCVRTRLDLLLKFRHALLRYDVEAVGVPEGSDVVLLLTGARPCCSLAVRVNGETFPARLCSGSQAGAGAADGPPSGTRPAIWAIDDAPRNELRLHVGRLHGAQNKVSFHVTVAELACVPAGGGCIEARIPRLCCHVEHAGKRRPLAVKNILAAEVHMPTPIASVQVDGLREPRADGGCCEWRFASDQTFATLPPRALSTETPSLRVLLDSFLADPCAFLRSCAPGTDADHRQGISTAAAVLHIPLGHKSVRSAQNRIAEATVEHLHIFVDGAVRGMLAAAARCAVVDCLAKLQKRAAKQPYLQMQIEVVGGRSPARYGPVVADAETLLRAGEWARTHVSYRGVGTGDVEPRTQLSLALGTWSRRAAVGGRGCMLLIGEFANAGNNILDGITWTTGSVVHAFLLGSDSSSWLRQMSESSGGTCAIFRSEENAMKLMPSAVTDTITSFVQSRVATAIVVEYFLNANFADESEPDVTDWAHLAEESLGSTLCLHTALGGFVGDRATARVFLLDNAMERHSVGVALPVLCSGTSHTASNPDPLMCICAEEQICRGALATGGHLEDEIGNTSRLKRTATVPLATRGVQRLANALGGHTGRRALSAGVHLPPYTHWQFDRCNTSPANNRIQACDGVAVAAQLLGIMRLSRPRCLRLGKRAELVWKSPAALALDDLYFRAESVHPCTICDDTAWESLSIDTLYSRLQEQLTSTTSVITRSQSKATNRGLHIYPCWDATVLEARGCPGHDVTFGSGTAM